MICLRTELPEVQAQLQEYTNILGDSDAAYYVLSENNGYGLDYAPNGAQSKLFSDLLDYYGGDTAMAIRAKAKVYSQSFRDWFGDWLSEDKTDVSKVVDENDEPLIVYHGGVKNINIFDTTGSKKTGAGIQKGIKGTYFTPSISNAKRYEEIASFKISNMVDGVLDAVSEGEISKEDADEIFRNLGTDIYATFLNIRNPIINEYVYDKKKITNKDGTYREHESKTIIEEKHNKPKDYDGQNIIIKHPSTTHYSYPKEQYVTVESYDEIEWVVINPNQIKSIDNEGNFSVDDANIYRNQPEENSDEFSDITILFNELEKIQFENTGINGEHKVRELLQILESYLDKSDLTIRRLFNLFKESDITIKVVDPKTHPEIEKYYVYYDTELDQVFVNSETFNQQSLAYNSITLIHELVHAHTARMISRVENNIATQTEKDIYNECEQIRQKLYDKYKSKMGKDGKFHDKYYGLNNIYEFTSELLSNRQFYKLVENNSIDGNWYDVFINLLRSIAKSLISNFNDHLYTKEDIDILADDLVHIVSYDIEDRINNYNIENANNNFDYGQKLNTLMLQKEAENISFTEEDKNNLDIVLSGLAESIKSGFESMLKVSNDPDPVLRAQIRAQAEWQIANIRDGLVDNLTNVINFLNNLGSQLLGITEEVINHSNNNIPFTDEKLNDLDQNFYGFYNSIVDKIVKDLSLNRPFREILGQDKNGDYVLDKLVAKALTHQKALSQGHSVIQREIIRNAQRRMKEIGIKVNPNGLYEYSQYSTEQLKDINSLTRYLGAADKVNNDALKSIFYLINQAEENTNIKVNQLQVKLQKLLNKAGKYNQRLLLEIDDDGNTTGWFTRSRNYGKFEKNYREAMDKICLSLGIDPTELHLPENKSIRIEYNKQRNEWLSRHCDRRYTKEYYDMFNSLSEETQKQREVLQVQIRQILSKTVDEYGMYHRDKLSEEDKQSLLSLSMQKKQLASIYDVNGVKKQGIQLQIAEELTELNSKLSKGLNRTKISDAYYKKREQILNDKNLSQAEKDEWIKNNTRIQYKQEFYDKLKKLEKKYYGDKYAAASERRRAILSQFRDDSTGEVMVEYMPRQTKINIAKLESTMRVERLVAKNRRKVQKIEGEYTFEEIAHVVPTSRWYQDKKIHYDAIINDDPDFAEAWLKANSFVTKVQQPNGKFKFEIRPKAWYTKIVPNDPSMIEEVPTQDWMEIDDSSEFINKDYIAAKKEDTELIDEYWIPKKQVIEKGKKISYDSSERFNRIKQNENLYELRKELLNIIKETNSLMTNLHKTYPFRVPQRSGSIFTYINAGFRSNGFAGALKAVNDYFTDYISVKNDDPGFNKALIKPNGERLNLIPQNYLVQLENPEYLSADVIKDVVDFYRSGLNWSNKTKIQPQIEILKQYLGGLKFKSSIKGVAKSGKDSNTYKMASSFIDMNLYDIKNKVAEITIGKPNDNGKIFGVLPQHFHLFGLNFMPYVDIKPRTVDITKLLNILRRVGTSVNLGLNFVCAFTGGITALYSHTVNALVGRYYNLIDAGYALKDMLSDILLNVINRTGIVRYKPRMSRLMEYYRIGADNRLDPTNMPEIVNQIYKHSLFGAYTFWDHFVKGQILGAVANNFKLVIDSKGNKRFMCREDYKRDILNNNSNIKDMIDWNLSDKLTFYDAINVVNGEIIAKDPENQKYVDEVKDQIGNIARVLAGSADGQLTDLQRPVLMANAFGQLAMMHRQYLPIIIQERFGMALQYDYQMRKYREALFLSLSRVAKEAIEVDDGIIRHIKKSYKNDIAFRENIRKLFFEIGMWIILSQIIRPIVTSSADDDKKNIIKQMLAFIIERTTFETLAPYNVLDMFNTLKSVSAIMSYVQNMQSFAANIYNILEKNVYSLFSDEPPYTKIVNKGAYKGMTDIQRDMIKLTPFKNVIELQDIQSKRNYYRRMILNEKD